MSGLPKEPRRMPRRRIAGIAVAALLMVAALWAAGGRAGTAAATGETWAEVHRQDLVIGAEVSGTLSAVQSAQLGPPQIPDVWDYKLAFMAPEGIDVKRGRPVLGFDTTDLARTLLDKQAERDSAQKELEKKQANLEIARRDDELKLAEAEAKQRKAHLKVDVPPELVSANSLSESKTDLALATSEIAYLKDKLRLARVEGGAELGALRDKRDRAAGRVAEVQRSIAQMTVVAPRDGTVIYIANRQSEKRKIGDACWRGEKVIEIPDLRQMNAEGEIDEADAGRVAVGQRVSLRLDAHPDVTFTGRVELIRAAVQSRSANNPQKVVHLRLVLDRTDPQRMRPGMRFLGTIEIERVAQTLVAPAEAVFNRSDGPVVYRRTRFGVEPVRPVLGRRNGRLVEVKSGLVAGDLVSRRIPDGMEGDDRGGKEGK